MNENWTRWIWASVRKYMDDNRDGLYLFYEGDHRLTADIQEFAEVRMDGPRVREPSKNHFVLDVYINILTQCVLSKTDGYAHQRLTGKVMVLFGTCIPIYRYGTPGDDSKLGDLILQYSRRSGPLRFANFGQIDEKLRLQQSTTEGHYRMTLDL